MEKYKNLFMPGAILGAGVLIAISVFATGGLNIPTQEGLGAQVKSEQPVELGLALYQKLAEDMDLNISQFNDCVASRKYKDKVESDLQEGIRLGVNGTPGTFVNAVSMRGALPYEQVKSIIDTEIASGNIVLAQGLSVTEKDHVKGNPNAKVTLVEFSDFQCPFCKRFHPTVQQALSEYGDQIRLVYKHFPLDSIHPQARPAAEASECIAEQKGSEGFWQFADAVFKI